MQFVEILVYLFYTYLGLGLIFSIWFVFAGVNRVDTGMQGVKWIMRLMLIPGTMALWPLMLKKYLNARS